MQLKRGALALALATAAAGDARATQDAAVRITEFREPSTENRGVNVVHPQVDAGSTLGRDFRVGLGYEVDIVSGATPAVFGPRTGKVDVITSATKFSDVRQEVHANLSYERPTSSVAVGYAYGWESDYRSNALTATTRSDLLDHNFTLGLSYTHNWDSVCDANNSAVGDQPLALKALTSSAHCFSSSADVATQPLAIDTFQPSLSWTATPRLILQIGNTTEVLDGFQSNPYRSVQLGRDHRTPQEHLPELRQRYALYARAIYALPAERASFFGMGRVYRDSWAVQAATAEALINKYLGQKLLVTVRGRYHQQGGASFYRDGVGYLNLGPGGQYWTGDRELSPMSNFLAGGKIALLRRPEQERASWFAEMELDVKFEVLFYHLDSPDAPNADRKRAYILQAAYSLRF